MSDYPPISNFYLPAFVTVMVYQLNARSGIAVGHARSKYRVPLPRTDGPPEFERIYRAHANNAEQYPQFLALMWTSALIVNGLFAGLLGIVWVILRHYYVTAYHRSAEKVENFTIPAYLVQSGYATTITIVLIMNVYRMVFNSSS